MPMHPAAIAGCIAVISVGVAIIMYTLLRTPKTPAKFGTRSSIDLGEEIPDAAGSEDVTQEEPPAEETSDTV